MSNKIEYLKMIQEIIKRMARNSFLIKGWVLTLAVAMTAFIPKTVYIFVPIIILSILLFACLDAYYLQNERKYRKLYDMARNKQEDEIDFDLKTTEKVSYIRCVFSKSILCYYIPILIVIVGIIIGIFL